MKALSIRQPWAHLILHGGKDIENRVWRTKFRGRFLIHAAKREDKIAMLKYVGTEPGQIHPDDLLHGAIIGSAELVDVVDQSDSKWFEGPHGFVLKDPRPEKIKFVSGQLQFFEVDLET